jgi:hypothetical protein
MLDPVGQEKTDQPDVGSNIEKGAFFDMSSQERQALEIRNPRIKHSRRKVTVGIGAKLESIKERNNQWSSD